MPLVCLGRIIFNGETARVRFRSVWGFEPVIFVLWCHQTKHVSCIKDVIWLADACLKEVEGKNEQDGRVLKVVSTEAVFPLDFAYNNPIRASERINNVSRNTCWNFWRYRSLRIGSRRRNWRRFVLRFVVRCISSFVVVSDSLRFLFFPRIYQIRITTRRMPKEMARCRKRSCSTETRHSKNHGTYSV